MNSIGNTPVCPNCHWQISPKDIFCGGCAYQLVRITVTPDPDEDLRGAPWTVFSGIPITLKVKNEGVNPIQIRELKAQGFGITQRHGDIDLPYRLDTKESVELRCSHNAHERSIGRLELLSSIKPVVFFVRCEKAPEILLVSPDEHEFEHDTVEYQPCAIDPDDGRISLTLRHDSPLRLQAAPYLSEGKDHFDLPSDQEFPDKFNPEHPFRFSLIRRRDFEETCPATLNFPFDSLGEITFRLLLRYVNRPKIEWEFSRQFINDQALVSGGNKKMSFTVTVKHLSGPPLRITRVESNQPWLITRIQITDQEPILIDNSSSQIDLILNQDTLPTVEENTTDKATLVIHGATVGEGETFHQSISLPVQIRPPQLLDSPIAVDFGTTNSCIAYIDQDAQDKEELLKIDLGEDVSEMGSEIPTVFQFLAFKNPDDLMEVLLPLGADVRRTVLKEREALVKFGHTLKDLRLHSEHISSISWGFKRTLRTPHEQIIYNDLGTGSLSLNGRIYTQGNRYIEVGAIEKVGLYIRFLLESFQENTGYVPSKAVFTYPAVFNRQKESLRKAIAWATQGLDLKPILDISEPEAIALAYARDIAIKQDPGRDIVYGVFDCGGGTTDISIVRLTPQEYGRPDIEILASDGDVSLGGDLLSFKIAQYLYFQMVPEVYRTQFSFPDTLDKALRPLEKIEEDNFSQLYGLAETIKENSRITSFLEEALEPEDYAEHLQDGEIGILDLIRSSNIPDNWPRVSLKSKSPENTTLSIEGTLRFLDDNLLPDMAPLAINDIYNSVREELEKGFDKLVQMQQYLFNKNQIADTQLDYLILEGNTSRLPLVKTVAKEKVQAKEIIFEPEKLKKSVALGAVEYGRSLSDLYPFSPKGIRKLNYPICMRAFTHFVLVFDRWTPLRPCTTITPENPGLIIEIERASSRIALVEFFGWDLNTRVTQGENRVVANLTVPKDDDVFQNAQFWTYYLELRCDAGGEASLWYNYRVGNQRDGSDFEYVWRAHRQCEGFSYT